MNAQPVGLISTPGPYESPDAAMSILIVDDDWLGRETLAALLDPQGYQLAFAAGGAEALHLAALIQPDLILLDVMMPGLDGFEVCRQLRVDAVLGGGCRSFC